MLKLDGDILATIGALEGSGDLAGVEVRSVTADSRRVGPGALFNVVKTTFYRKCSSSEKLGGPFTQAEAVEFLEAL